MHRLTPARFLAPLALIAAAFAVYALVQPSADSGSASPSTAAKTKTVASGTAKKPSVHSIKRAKTYVVKAGDTLSGIALKAGLTVEHITQLNPGLDANSLNVGRTLKLRT